MGCERRLGGFPTHLAFVSRADSTRGGGRLRFGPAAPLSAPPHIEGGQLRSRRSSPLSSPSPSSGPLGTAVGSKLR
jgi:hypothetical protein